MGLEEFGEEARTTEARTPILTVSSGAVLGTAGIQILCTKMRSIFPIETRTSQIYKYLLLQYLFNIIGPYTEDILSLWKTLWEMWISSEFSTIVGRL